MIDPKSTRLNETNAKEKKCVLNKFISTNLICSNSNSQYILYNKKLKKHLNIELLNIK